MKTFSIFKSQEGPNPHPQEDFMAVSKKYPIFAVADGVSLNVEKGQNYPEKSGASEAARIFCETVVASAEERYGSFSENDLAEIFDDGNKAVLDYNISQGRTKETINYFDFDYFSATTSFILIKENRIFWWSLCDAGIFAMDKKGENEFASPNGWINFPADWVEDKYDKKKVSERHKDYRNAIDQDGRLAGYGVVTGEKIAEDYLNIGELSFEDGDLAFAFTDGFENYFDLKEFKDLFIKWPENLQEELEALISKKSKENQSKYGREKTLIAIKN